MIEHVHIQLSRVMTGYAVRAAFNVSSEREDQAGDVAVLHGWIGPVDQESEAEVLEHLSEELFNLAPRARPRARTVDEVASPLHWLGREVRGA